MFRGSGAILARQPMLDLRRKMRHWDRLFQYFGISVSVSFYRCSILSHSYIKLLCNVRN